MRRALLLAALALGAAVAGCVVPGGEVEPAAVALSQPRPFDVLAEHAPVEAPDGTVLDAWVFRPDTDEPVPIILNFSPYWSNAAPPAATGGDAFSLYLIDHFVPRGYAVALVSARGTGLSEGCFTIGGPVEVEDESLVVDALASQPWSNGNVTATGKSYDGTMAQSLLTANNPHVKTIVPVAPISELYKYNHFAGVPYPNGYLTNQFNTYYVLLTSLAQSDDPQDPTWEKLPTRFCAESVDVQANQYHSTLTGDYTPYWQARNYSALLPERVDASVFYIHGLQDWNVKPDHMVPWIDELRARGVTVKMWLGQWAHDYPHRADFNETLLRWLDHHLKGIDTGILDEPLVQVQGTDGVWRHEAQWPPARAAPLALHPGADGTLGATPGSGASAYRDAPAPGASVRFDAEPLAEDLRLSGAPVLFARVAATTPRATLAATLLADGAVVGQGFLDLAHRDGLETTQPLVPGTAYDVTVSFYPLDVALPAGTVLTLVLGHDAPEDAPAEAAPWPSGGLVTVHHDGTTLVLPALPLADATVEAPQPEDVGCWAC